VSKVSWRFWGRESSRFGGRDLPVNSSWTEMVACLRQTASSCTVEQSLAKGGGVSGGGGGACFYRRDCEEHDDQLLLPQHRMSN